MTKTTVDVDAGKTVIIEGFRHAEYDQKFHVYRKIRNFKEWTSIGQYRVDTHTKFSLKPRSEPYILRFDAFNRKNDGHAWRRSEFFRSKTDDDVTWLYWDDQAVKPADDDLEVVITQT